MQNNPDCNAFSSVESSVLPAAVLGGDLQFSAQYGPDVESAAINSLVKLRRAVFK